ncbi:hypothetical protein [Fangia hongkongensis]|uniref:hypothetical protein n=1 Tax=Fangia hongkongensis TaxID=270495 RepID=UPI000367B94D|nr:hypothetical protein [Fangia hongkongensis]MBK2124417.1 hypothetical protein [Fangia hongkongensis]
MSSSLLPTSVVTKVAENQIEGKFESGMQAVKSESNSPRLVVKKGQLVLSIGGKKVDLAELKDIYDGNNVEEKITADAVVTSFWVSDDTVRFDFVVSSESHKKIQSAIIAPNSASISFKLNANAFETKQFAFVKEDGVNREWDQITNNKTEFEALSEHKNDLMHGGENYSNAHSYSFTGRLKDKVDWSIPGGVDKGQQKVITLSNH